MQYFRFLPDPAKLRKEARWSDVSSVPGITAKLRFGKKHKDANESALSVALNSGLAVWIAGNQRSRNGESREPSRSGYCHPNIRYSLWIVVGIGDNC